MGHRIVIAGRRGLELALLVLIALVLVAAVLGRLVPLTGARTIVIDGRSMEPTIPLGSAVIVVPVSPAALARGDVVSVRVGAAGTIVTHRVVRVVEGSGGPLIETRGDANEEPDPALSPATDVIGRVAWSVPALGLLLYLLATPVGIAFVLLVGAALLVALALIDGVEADLRRRGPVPPLGAAGSS